MRTKRATTLQLYGSATLGSARAWRTLVCVKEIELVNHPERPCYKGLGRQAVIKIISVNKELRTDEKSHRSSRRRWSVRLFISPEQGVVKLIPMMRQRNRDD